MTGIGALSTGFACKHLTSERLNVQAGCNFEPTAMARPCLCNHTFSASTIHWPTAVDQEHSGATTDLQSLIFEVTVAPIDWIVTSGVTDPGTIETGYPTGIQGK
jgi:hypothetical protein